MDIKSLSIAAGVFSLLLGGCQTASSLFTEQMPGADMSRYATFAVLPLDRAIPGANAAVVARAVPIVSDVIRDALKAKGYREVEPAEADFTVALNAAILPELDVQEWGYTPAHATDGWYSSYTDYVMATRGSFDTINQAHVAVLIHDRVAKELVWVGYGTALRNENTTANERIDRTVVAVLEMLESFPAAASGGS